MQLLPILCEPLCCHSTVWDTLGRDPLFAPPTGDLTMAQKRELTFERTKRLYEYDFLPEDVFLSCPMKAHALQVALLSLDSSLLPSYTLSADVSKPIPLSLCLIKGKT